MRLDYLNVNANTRKNEVEDSDRVRVRFRNFLYRCKNATERFALAALVVGGLALVPNCSRVVPRMHNNFPEDAGKADVQKPDAGRDVFSSEDGPVTTRDAGPEDAGKADVQKPDAGRDVFSSEDGPVTTRCPEWMIFENSPNNLDDKGHAIAVDSQDNVITIGESQNGIMPNGVSNIVIHKREPNNGDILWAKVIPGLSNADKDSLNRAVNFDVAVDAEDNIIAIATISVSEGLPKIWVGKYDSEGNELWTDLYWGDSIQGYSEGIAVAPNGDIFALATWDKPPNFKTNVRRYNKEGDLLWQSGNSNNGVHLGHDIAVIDEEYVFIAGEKSLLLDSSVDSFAERLANGNVSEWVDIYDLTPSDKAFGIAIDAISRIIATGSVQMNPDTDLLIRVLDSSGNPVWTKTYAKTFGDDAGLEIATDAVGYYYVTGYKSTDAWTIKVDPDGAITWERTFNGRDNLSDQGSGIAVDSNGCVLVVGKTGTVDQGHNMWVAKYNNSQ